MAITASARVAEVWDGNGRHFVVEIVDANGERVVEPVYKFATREEAKAHIEKMCEGAV